MKTILKSMLLLTALTVMSLGMTSCSKDDAEPSCKTCSATQVMYMDGVEMVSQTLPATELCDEALEAVEANPLQTATQNVGGITQEVVITYSCQ